ncbi:MAG: rhodanese-like domain-containing protein [Actinobacteria bacterium]|nr:rhodanese-like domain-containing protein [Actinomycetota bacterium]MBM3713981.1 rhodanese-like domain-containing protein [Actinomycetota bacterium]
MKKANLKNNLFAVFSPVVICIVIVIISIVFIPGCKTKNVHEASLKPDSLESLPETESTLPVDENVLSEEELKAQIKDISVEEVYEIISSGRIQDYIILDVRTPEEFSEGYIEGALLIPVSELEGRLNELSKDKPIIIYCRSGRRSMEAAIILVKNGFTQVYDMGGINDWIANGYPTESGGS